MTTPYFATASGNASMRATWDDCPTDSPACHNTYHSVVGRCSGATDGTVLASQPMLGDSFVQAAAEAAVAGDREAHRRVTASWRVLLVAWEILERSTCNLALTRTARREIMKLDYVTLVGYLERILNVADGKTLCRDWRIELARRMLDFADFLRTIVKWDMAGDVYGMLAQTLDLPDAIRMAAVAGRAWALRELGRLDEAEMAYYHLREIANMAGDLDMKLQADLGLARILGHRGDIAAMEAGARQVVAVANAYRCPNVEGMAHIDLSYSAGLRGDHKAAICHCDAAIRCQLTELQDERCRLNMAFAYRQIEWFEDARGMASLLAAQSPHESHRNEAAILLYEIAITARDVSALGYYRAFLARAFDRLTPAQREEFQQYRNRETALPYTPSKDGTLYQSRPADADPDLVDIAERTLASLSSASAA